MSLSTIPYPKDTYKNKETGKPGTQKRIIQRSAWIFLGIAVVVTFVAFMELDPEPNVILSGFTAINVGIFLYAIYRFYQWDLLLSPMSTFVIGPGTFMFYTWGNLGSRIAFYNTHGHNPGSLDYYPLVAFLTTIGLLLFCVVVFTWIPKIQHHTYMRYQDFLWKPWQVLSIVIFNIVLIGYLSYKYEFIGGYFRNVGNTVDRWLVSSYYFFIVLGVISAISLLVRAKNIVERWLGLGCVAALFILAVATRSRTFMLSLTIVAELCWVSLRPKQVRLSIIIAGLVGVGLYMIGSVVKEVNVQGESFSMIDNVLSVFNSDYQQINTISQASSNTDYTYRVAGYEMSAAIILSLNKYRNEPMYGQGVIGGLIQGLPNFIRPVDYYNSERGAISNHFVGRGLMYDDSIGIPLTSGVADWGVILGPLIFIILAFYCLALWRVVQISPKLMLAYLIACIGPVVTDLFWDDGFFYIRAIGFSWIILTIFSRILLPAIKIKTTE